MNSDGDRLKTKEEIVKDPGLAMTFQANQMQDRDYFAQAMDYLLFHERESDAATRGKYIDACMKQRNMVDAADAANRFNISSVSNGLADGTGELGVFNVRSSSFGVLRI